MKYTWLIFDADGTLFDYDQAEHNALSMSCSHFGLGYDPVTLQIYRHINGHMWRQFEMGLMTPEEVELKRFEELFAETDIKGDPAAFSEIYRENLGKQSVLINGAEETVKTLHKHYKLLILTNGLSPVQWPRLKNSTIKDYFEDMVISQEEGVAKPDPGIFEIAFARMNNPAKEEVLMIGDSLSSDIAGANRYGLDACWFNPNGVAQAVEVAFTYEIKQLTELIDLLAFETK